MNWTKKLFACIVLLLCLADIPSVSGQNMTNFTGNLTGIPLSRTECSESISLSFLLAALVFMSILLIISGIFLMSSVTGLFGSFMLMASSWYVAPCAAFISYMMALFSLVFIILFAIRMRDK